MTARNKNYLEKPRRFLGRWNLAEAQDTEIDEGSEEASLRMMSMEKIDWLARKLLDLQEMPLDELLLT